MMKRLPVPLRLAAALAAATLALQCGPARPQEKAPAERPMTLHFRMIEDTGSGGTAMALKGTDDRYRVGERILAGEGDIASVSVEAIPHERYLIRIAPNQGGKEKLSRITARGIGKKLGVVINGELVSVSIIREFFTSAEYLITGAITEEEAGRIRKAFPPAPSK